MREDAEINLERAQYHPPLFCAILCVCFPIPVDMCRLTCQMFAVLVSSIYVIKCLNCKTNVAKILSAANLKIYMF